MTQSPRRRQYFGGGVPDIVILPPVRKDIPLVHGKGRSPRGPVSSRSTSSASVILPSISSRCTSISPYPLDSCRTSPSPAVLASKRSSPGLSSVQEEFVCKAEDLPRGRLQAGYSGAETTYGLAKLVDPIVFAQEAANVDTAAKNAAHLPNVQVSILALDTLSRIARLLPAQRLVLESVLLKVEGCLYVGRGVSRSIKRAEIFGRMQTPVLHIESPSESSSDSCPEERPEKTQRVGRRSNVARHMPILLIPPVPQKPRKRVTAVGFKFANRRTEFETYVHAEAPDLVRPPIEIDPEKPRGPLVMTHRPQHAENKPMRWFEGHPAYFDLVRKINIMIEHAKHKVSWMEEICAGLTGQGEAAHSLLCMASEMTSGSLLGWCFAFWKDHFTVVSLLDYQITRLQVIGKTHVVAAWLAWKLLYQRSQEMNTKRELQDRKVEFELMAVDMAHTQYLQDTVDERLEINNGMVVRRTDHHSKAQEKRLKLESDMNSMKPELLKPAVIRTLESLCGYAVDICKLQWISCKRRFFRKDLSMLFMQTEETAPKFDGMPCEAMLVRWINYFLTVAKRQAAELIDLGVKDAVCEAKGDWSSKELPKFTSRCRQVRGCYLINDLGEDLRNGVVLAALYAMLKACRSKQSHFDPAHLWPLDERNEEGKAAALCECFQSLAPTTAARCLLDKSDILRCNRRVLIPYFACLFLHTVPSAHVSDACSSRLTVKKLCHLLKHVRNTGHGATRASLRTGLSAPPLEIIRKLSSDPSMQLMARGLPQQGWLDVEEANFIFESDSSSDEEVDGHDDDVERANQLEVVFDSLEASSGSIVYETFADPARLLYKDETLTSLLEVPVKDILLRWLNLHTTDQRQVIKNFSSDLSNGFFLLRVISKIAPEVVSAAGMKLKNLPDAGEYCVQAVMECGARTVEAFNLTAEVLQEGREDLIACFVGKLFLVRPTLSPHTGSAAWKNLKTVEKFIREGYAICDARADKNYFAQFQDFCKNFHHNKSRMDEALNGLIESERLKKLLFKRVQQFVERSYSQRAGVSRPQKGGGAAVRAQLQNDVLMECVKVAQWRTLVWAEARETLEDHVRQTIQVHGKVLQVIFNRYSLPTLGTYRLPLEGLMKVYRSCRLRCPCAHLPPHVAEMLYYQILQDDLPPWRKRRANKAQSELEGLSARGFIRWLLRIALHRHDQLTLMGAEPVSFRETLQELIFRHFKPSGLQVASDEFTSMSNMPEVRKVFLACEPSLRAMFEFYGEEADDCEVWQGDDDQERAEEEAEATTVQVLSPERFTQIFKDAKLLKGLLNQDALSHIVSNILAIAGIVGCDSFEEVGHTLGTRTGVEWLPDHIPENTSEDRDQTQVPGMTFFEFTDALLAAAVHVHPNPFLNIALRVEQFLTKTFFPAVNSHWQDWPASSIDKSEKQRQELVSVLSGIHVAQIRNRMDVRKQRTLSIFQARQSHFAKQIQLQRNCKVLKRMRPSSASRATQEFVDPGRSSQAGNSETRRLLKRSAPQRRTMQGSLASGSIKEVHQMPPMLKPDVMTPRNRPRTSMNERGRSQVRFIGFEHGVPP